MAMASSKQSFLTNIPLTSIYNHSKKLKPQPQPQQLLTCRSSMEKKDTDPSSSNEMRLAKLAIVTFAAGVLTLGSVHDAVAAKSGGRVGGQAFRSSSPRPSSPRINNSRTNVFINPPVAPPLVGGYGYGYGVPFYGGWGWSPFTFFAPGPSVAVGIGGGFDLFAAFLLLGAVAAVVRRFTRQKEDEDEDEDY